MTAEGACDVLRASFCPFGVRPASKKAQRVESALGPISTLPTL